MGEYFSEWASHADAWLVKASDGKARCRALSRGQLPTIREVPAVGPSRKHPSEADPLSQSMSILHETVWSYVNASNRGKSHLLAASLTRVAKARLTAHRGFSALEDSPNHQVIERAIKATAKALEDAKHTVVTQGPTQGPTQSL